MNKLLSILSVAVITTVVLAGCTNPFSGGEKAGTGDGETGADIAMVESEGTGSVGTIDGGGVTNEASEANGVPSSRYGDDLKCSQLKNLESQQFCEMQLMEIIGSMLESEILNSYDAERCKELPGEVAESCTARLNEIGVKGPVTAEEAALFNEIVRGSIPEPTGDDRPEALYPVYDSGRCAELKTSGYREYCEKMIAERVNQALFDEIIFSGNSARCDELKTAEDMERCRLFLGVTE